MRYSLIFCCGVAQYFGSYTDDAALAEASASRADFCRCAQGLLLLSRRSTAHNQSTC